MLVTRLTESRRAPFPDTLEDGFTCPEGEVMGPTGRPLPHPTFPHAEDCQKFYICRNGVVPQPGSCPYGEVYNEETFKCDEPANVQGWSVVLFLSESQTRVRAGKKKYSG